jgi:hypothetical protein
VAFLASSDCLQLHGEAGGCLGPFVGPSAVTTGGRLLGLEQGLLGQFARLTDIVGCSFDLALQLDAMRHNLGGLIAKILVALLGLVDCLLDLDLRVHGRFRLHAKQRLDVAPEPFEEAHGLILSR